MHYKLYYNRLSKMTSEGMMRAMEQSIIQYMELHKQVSFDELVQQIKQEYSKFTLRPVLIPHLINNLSEEGRLKIKEGQVIWKR